MVSEIPKSLTRRLEPDETVIWSARPGRPSWGKIIYWLIPTVILGIFVIPGISVGLLSALLIFYGLLAFWQIGRSFCFYYALTNQRFIVANSFLFPTVRSFPPRWMFPELIWTHATSDRGNVHLPCSCEGWFGEGQGQRSGVKDKARYIPAHHKICWNCYLGGRELLMIEKPAELVALIKSTLGPLRKGDEKKKAK